MFKFLGVCCLLLIFFKLVVYKKSAAINKIKTTLKIAMIFLLSTYKLLNANKLTIESAVSKFRCINAAQLCQTWYYF